MRILLPIRRLVGGVVGEAGGGGGVVVGEGRPVDGYSFIYKYSVNTKY